MNPPSWPAWLQGMERLVRLQDRAIRGRKKASLGRALRAKERWLLARPTGVPGAELRGRLEGLAYWESVSVGLLRREMEGLWAEISSLRNQKRILAAYGRSA